MLGKLVTAMRPGPFDSLDEATLNAAIALISSMNPRTELAAMMAVQIAATGFAGLKFLRQSQHHMDEIYIDVYGGYAMKLFKFQVELLHAMDRHQRGNQQTVEVRHVHIHSGAQGVVGIVNAGPEGRIEMKDDPMHPNPSSPRCAKSGVERRHGAARAANVPPSREKPVVGCMAAPPDRAVRRECGMEIIAMAATPEKLWPSRTRCGGWLGSQNFDQAVIRPSSREESSPSVRPPRGGRSGGEVGERFDGEPPGRPRRGINATRHPPVLRGTRLRSPRNCRKRPRMRANRGPSDARARSRSTMFDRRAGARSTPDKRPAPTPLTP